MLPCSLQDQIFAFRRAMTDSVAMLGGFLARFNSFLCHAAFVTIKSHFMLYAAVLRILPPKGLGPQKHGLLKSLSSAGMVTPS